nr:peroxidase [Rhizobium sp. ACO-34A]
MASILNLADIQGTVLRSRPMPYFGSYLMFTIHEANAVGTLLRRLIPHITSAADWNAPAENAWINIVFSYAGLRKLVGDKLLEGFPKEFRQGMAARSGYLGDVGVNAPEHWDLPHGGNGFDIGLLVMAGSLELKDAKLATGREALDGIPGVELINRLDVGVPPTLREHFGYVDGISHPFIEGQGGSPLSGQDVLKPGEFILGYENELGSVASLDAPEALWRNGTFVAIRKIRQDVAAFRRFLHEAGGGTTEGAEMLAAKMMGRWRSGAPLALSPDKDDPALAQESSRNNAFSYYQTDAEGRNTPVGSHIRRVNPRDALKDSLTNIRLHRVLRRGFAFGPSLPDNTMIDDGIDRGIMLAIINANPGRQFEFVQAQWVNDGDFITQGTRTDPIVGRRDQADDYQYPAKPVRKRVQGIPAYTATRGGEHVFLPGISAIRWVVEQYFW